MRLTPSHRLVRCDQIWSHCCAPQAAAALLPCGFVALNLMQTERGLLNPWLTLHSKATAVKRRGKKNCIYQPCDINRLFMLIIYSKYTNADVTIRQTWCSAVINRGWHFHSSRLSRSAQDLASMHICITLHKNSPKCPNLFLSAFWSANKKS